MTWRTLSHFEFPSGVQAHIFVSWLHPIKEQRQVVVGSEKMAVFDDTAENKLVLYPHKVEWKNRIVEAGVLRCLDLDEEAPLPAELSVGNKSYKQIKEESNYEYSAARP